MHCIEQNKDFFDRPVCLSPIEREYPLRVLKNYFDQFDLSEVRIQLYQLYNNAINSKGDFDDAKERKNISWFVQVTEEALEAALLVAQKYKV